MVARPTGCVCHTTVVVSSTVVDLTLKVPCSEALQAPRPGRRPPCYGAATA